MRGGGGATIFQTLKRDRAKTFYPVLGAAKSFRPVISHFVAPPPPHLINDLSLMFEVEQNIEYFTQSAVLLLKYFEVLDFPSFSSYKLDNH